MKTARGSISSNLATALILGVFVGLVIVGLVFAYAFPGRSNVSGFSGITLSQVILYSGNQSSYSLTQTCNGDSELQITLLNNSTNTIDITNITLYGGSLSRNYTVLVPVSNGCVPVSQSDPAIAPDASDYVVLYPSVSFPLFPPVSCLADISFSDGQNFTGIGLIPGPLENQ
jgi:hypothetical protein